MLYLTAGESHGKYLCGILEGLPSGIEIDEKYIANNLKKRREVMGRSERQKIEEDRFEIISGLYNGKTTGMPVGIIIENKKKKRYPDNYIPLHGEYFASIKYKNNSYSVFRERLSQRETAIRVALFSFTRKMLEELEIQIKSDVLSCFGTYEKEKFKDIIDNFKKEGESFGGVFEIKITNLIPGIGGFSQGEERLQAKISKILFSIGSIKGVEFGAGFSSQKYKTSDFIEDQTLLGGIEGGISRGDDIIIRCVTRPLSAIKKIYKDSVSDVTSVFAAAYISEFLVSYVIAEEIIKKFGSDVFDEIKKSYKSWKNSKTI